MKALIFGRTGQVAMELARQVDSAHLVGRQIPRKPTALFALGGLRSIELIILMFLRAALQKWHVGQRKKVTYDYRRYTNPRLVGLNAQTIW